MKAMVIGGIAIDDITLPDTKMERVVGGSAVYGSLASALFAPTILGGVLGSDFPKTFLGTLKKRGVDLGYLQRSQKPSFRWKARYSDDLSQITVTSQQVNAFTDFAVGKLPAAAKECSAVFISNNDPEIQLKLITSLPADVIKILDSMDIWMIEKKDVLLEVIKRADIFFLSQTEAGYLAENNRPLYQIVDRLLGLGPKVMIIKKGEYGLSVYGAMGTLSLPSYPLTHVVDPSGAGDALGGTVAGVLSKLDEFTPEAIATAVLVGSTVASFVVEGYATELLTELTLEEVLNRSRIFLSQLPNAAMVKLDALR